MIDFQSERMVPLLCVHDVRRSISFYRDVLGFEVLGQYPETPEVPGWASFRKGNIQLMVNSQEDPSQITSASDIVRSNDVTFYITVSAVEKLRQDLASEGIGVGEIDLQHYGMKQLLVEDPDGFRLVFQEPAR